MAVRLSALYAGRPLPSRRFLVLISIRDWADPRATMRLEGLRQLKFQWHWESKPRLSGLYHIASTNVAIACRYLPQCRFVHHKPHIPARTRTRATAVGSQRLTAWTMERPSQNNSQCTNTKQLNQTPAQILVFRVTPYLPLQQSKQTRNRNQQNQRNVLFCLWAFSLSI
jgi:hypothetical protein